MHVRMYLVRVRAQAALQVLCQRLQELRGGPALLSGVKSCSGSQISGQMKPTRLYEVCGSDGKT